MARIANLTLIGQCSHYRTPWMGETHGCALIDRCEPAEGADSAEQIYERMEACEKYFHPSMKNAENGPAIEREHGFSRTNGKIESVESCIHGPGEGTGNFSECDTCQTKVDGQKRRFATYACDIFGECVPRTGGVRLDFGPGVGCCAGCAKRVAKPVLQVKSISAGIGDNLLTMAIAEGLRRQWRGTEVVVVARAHHRWMSLFQGFRITSAATKSPIVFCEHDAGTASFQAFRSQKKARWEYWAEEFGVRPAIPELAPLPTAATERAIPLAGRVVLAPFSAYPDRTWPLDNWLQLEKLILCQGFRCTVISDTPHSVEQFTSAKVLGGSPQEVAALLAYSACVVGNDSGMAHLSGMMKQQTVAICSRTSDPNIFGLYPTVKMLGGHNVGFDSVTPEAVLLEALALVRADLGGFPHDRFASQVLERDRWRVPCWHHVYAALWRTVREINPRRIVEVGTRAGYSAWTMLDACPEATLIGFDADFDEHGGFKGACEHARKINPSRFELRVVDSHKLDKIPECDLFYVDGDHTTAGALSDITLGERSGVVKILVDDVTNLPDVRAAIAQFLAARPRWTSRFIPSDTGMVLLEKQ